MRRSKAFGPNISKNACQLLVEGLAIAHQTMCIGASHKDPGLYTEWRYGRRFDGLKPWSAEISVRTYRAAGGSRLLRLLELDPGAGSITPADVRERSARSLGQLACSLPTDEPATRLDWEDVSEVPSRYCDAHNKLLGTYPNTNTHRVALLARYVCDQIREESNKAGEREVTFLAWNLITLAWCFRKIRNQGFNCICEICFRRTEAGQKRCPVHARCDTDRREDNRRRVDVRRSLSAATHLKRNASWILLRHEQELIGIESILLPRIDYLDDLAGDSAVELLLNHTPRVKALVGNLSCCPGGRRFIALLNERLDPLEHWGPAWNYKLLLAEIYLAALESLPRRGRQSAPGSVAQKVASARAQREGGLTLREIGSQLGVSEARVSQLLKRADF